MADRSETLRAQIQATVKASGLKQIWIARQIGISQKYLSQMLLGRVVMTLDWAQRIAAVCGYQVIVTVQRAAHCDECPACGSAGRTS